MVQLTNGTAKMEVIPFTELITDCTKEATKLPMSTYQETGTTAIVDQGQDFIAGYTDKTDGIFTKTPAIIFGDHTRVFKYVDFPFFIGADGVKVLKATRKINYKYLYYYFLQAKFPNTGYARHFKWLKELKIPVPSTEKQNNIVSQLDKCTNLIGNYKQLLQKYDELIKSRFIEMFGDPVKNPMGWEVIRFGDLIESIRYGTSTPPIFSETGFAFIRATNIKNGKIINQDMKFISEEEALKIQKCKLNGNELLIVRSGVNSGDTCVVTKEYINQYAGYDMIIVLGDKLNPIYINELLNTNYMEKVIKPLTRRAAQPHLNSEQTQGLPIILPPMSLQEQFSSFVKQIDKSKFENTNTGDAA